MKSTSPRLKSISHHITRLCSVRAIQGWLLLVFSIGLAGCHDTPPATSPNSSPSAKTPEQQPELVQSIQEFCGACHAVPRPESFPKDDWYHEVQRGYDFYYKSGRKDLKPPVQADVARWFQTRAPESLEKVDDTVVPCPSVLITRHDLRPSSTAADSSTGISFVTPDPDHAARIWCSDMLNGHVRCIDAEGQLHADITGTLKNPAAIRFVDLNNNGKTDMVIADLASPLPADHQLGKIVWIPDYQESSEQKSLLSGIGRMADVRAADFDGDGDQDLVAAEFGWHSTGGLHVIWNSKDADGNQTWQPERLDSRPGTIHVPVIDIDLDGRPDFLALVSQEHEVIEAWLNRPSGFEKKRLYAAPDPTFGSSGIELTDFDSDGDQDILYTNGDTFDSKLIKPYHGIWLLKNEGSLNFSVHSIAKMPGVHRALPCDVDRDGDPDIVAASLLPPESLRGTDPETLQGVIWLEQTEGGKFTRHLVQQGMPLHAAMVVTDTNGDTVPEIVTGCFSDPRYSQPPILQCFELTHQTP